MAKRKTTKKATNQATSISSLDYLTPRQIVEELDKYVIGQNAAKKAVAIALRNRWRRQQVMGSMRDEIMPNNIIMIGPTGVGKTEIARRLARLSGAPFLKVEATKFTEVGYVGRDVESIIRDLADIAVAIVRSEKTAEVRREVTKAVEKKIIDLLLPALKRGPSFDTTTDYEIEQNKTERDLLLEQLRAGELDARMIEIDVEIDSMPSMHIMGPFNLEEMGIDIKEMFGNAMPKKNKRRKVSVAEARTILEEEETDKVIDHEKAINEAIARCESSGIVFLDEIDKVTSKSSEGSSPSVSREGVQRDLLPIVEGSTVNTKYGSVKTDHILFIASGAFHVSKPSDLIPELQGRFPIRVELSNLTEDDFVKILTIPENALIKQYQALMESEGITLEFSEDAIKKIASIAAQVNEEVENIGARRLHTILTALLDDIMFNAPDKLDEKLVIITEQTVGDKLNAIVKNVDLSKFIL
ncbi:MAG: ATP-dependent protease ATPase subunit HslU [Ignavibacteriae bacterium]|nr:ATP-dependent protease ATPase subunit HslU [Ignavibacteriota bacterium]